MNAIGISHQVHTEKVTTDRQQLVALLGGHVANPVVIESAATDLLAAGWRSPAGQAGTVDELEALPPGTVVTDPDGHVWVRNRVGEWCEPYPAGLDPDELLADGPVTVHCIPDPGPRTGANSQP